MKSIRVRASVPLLIVLAAVGMRFASGATANASYFALALYALYGRRQALQALALSCLFTLLSPAIAPDALGATLGRYLVQLAAAISVFIRSGVAHGQLSAKKVTLATLSLGAFFAVHSVIISPVLGVSVLKAVSWTVAMCTVTAGWVGLSVPERDALVRQIFGGLTVVMVASLPLLLTGGGYLSNGTGFQGALNQPQAFGAAMALLGAWSASEMLGQRKPRWSMVAVAGASFALVVLSEARTGGFALVLGVVLAAAFAPALAGLPVRAVLPGLRSKRLLAIALFGALGLVSASERVSEQFEHFVSKSGRSDASTVIDAFESSRGDLVETMWENIKQNPFTGIGFGIASEPEEMAVEYDPVLGLPTSAPVEKGVLPVAVLEEVGVFGFAAVAAWLLMLIRRSARGGVTPIAVGLTVLFLNMGESTLFSPGGIGLFTLVLLGWTFACSQKKVPVAR